MRLIHRAGLPHPLLLYVFRHCDPIDLIFFGHLEKKVGSTTEKETDAFFVRNQKARSVQSTGARFFETSFLLAS